MTLAVSQVAVDAYIAMYPASGPDAIARWKAAGAIVIVDEKVVENGDKNKN